MSKKIVVCCDGTGNGFDHVEEESNVAKLYGSITVDPGQRCYYHPGVGTMGSPNSRGQIGREWSKIKGLAFGAGLLANVGDAYRYLMDNYDDGDEIFLFGFSRGSFTVRALASLIHVYGLLCGGNQEAIPYILQMYSKASRKAKHQRKTFPPNEAFKWQFSHANPVRIKFCGIWDTVSSYGWIYDPIQLPFLGCNPIIDIGRHAISIHERRCFYKDNLWGTPQPTQDFRQVWFSGVHSDIGGSYPEQTSGLSKIALEWMLVEAAKAGLGIEEVKARVVLGEGAPSPSIEGLPRFAKTDANADLHVSLRGAWWLLEFLPQEDPHLNGKRWDLPMGRMRTIPGGSYIHQSVIEGKWKPENLPKHTVEPWVTFEAYCSQRDRITVPLPDQPHLAKNCAVFS
jgi:uncharacterized protein (DUF2235 family)